MRLPSSDNSADHLRPALAQNAVQQPAEADSEFPSELVAFDPYDGNPVFAGTGRDTWDRRIRERGYVLLEQGVCHLWYTGYRGGNGRRWRLYTRHNASGCPVILCSYSTAG